MGGQNIQTISIILKNGNTIFYKVLYNSRHQQDQLNLSLPIFQTMIPLLNNFSRKNKRKKKVQLIKNNIWKLMAKVLSSFTRFYYY